MILNWTSSVRGRVDIQLSKLQNNPSNSLVLLIHFYSSVAPRFIKKPASKSVPIKHDDELMCDVFASPEPKVYWLKNGDPISSNNEYLTKVNGYAIVSNGI